MSPATDLSALPPAIVAACDRLRALSQQDVRATWHRCPAEATGLPTAEEGQNWPLAPLNDRRHIAWARGKRPLVLHQRFTWPQALNGYPLAGLTARLALRWWANRADIFVNGEPVQTGDIFDCWTRVLLSDGVVPGESVDVSLALLSPGHDDGALVQAELVFEALAGGCPEPGFVADELTVLATYLAEFEAENLDMLTQAIGAIDWEGVGDRDRFHASLLSLRQGLEPFSPWLKQRTLHCLGHAHLDLAWLWPVAETWEAAENTFRSVLALQQDFPELTFTHSSPALFAWLEEHRPELFAAVQQQVRAGRWAIDAGLWVEPDLNLPGGEAIARQILYGQRYCAEKFGAVSAIAWLPDTFGFSWQLPQLLRQGGIRYFATQKLRWNDTNPFPHELFAWQGLDGTGITGVTLPPIGTDIDPVAMAAYACQWEARTGHPEALWLPGVGDHGGGPTRDMLQKAQRWAKSPFFPTLVWGHAAPLLDRLVFSPPPTSPPPTLPTSPLSPPPPPHLPPWRDELYLELHRGCYTTHGDQKWYNRRCEDRLFQAELWAAIAAIYQLQPYPQAELEAAWKLALFNQFHDILPGSSIPAVFEQANADWRQALEAGDRILQTSLQRLAEHCPQPLAPHPAAVPVVLFNPLNWERNEVVAIALDAALAKTSWQAQDTEGQPLPTQPALGEAALLVYVPAVPAVGYRLLWLVPAAAAPPATLPVEWSLENAHLRATLDPTTGGIASLIHRATGTETFRGGGNQLQAFKDEGQYWDAWNLAPDYQDHPLGGGAVDGMSWIEYGPVRQTMRVVHCFNRSTITQDYCLEVNSPVLAVHTTVDWQESQVVLKAAFPLTVAAERATYEIPFGAIARATVSTSSQDADPQDAAKWEVPALRWADLSGGEGSGDDPGDRGCSILTDYKHGFDATPSQLRLTLLKAPLWPDPTSDRGLQRFSYALYPHAQGWQQAQTVRQARNFNLPLRAVVGPGAAHGSGPTVASWLDLGDGSLVLAALKRAEDRPDRYILRCYESAGVATQLAMAGLLPVVPTAQTDLLEQPIGPADIPLEIRPWQVVSLAIAPRSNGEGTAPPPATDRLAAKRPGLPIP